MIRTTNLLERLFGEERRRMKVIANGFGERPVLKLMYAALIRATEQWRGITVTAFERKQWEVIRQEIAAAHGQRHASPVTRPRARVAARVPPASGETPPALGQVGGRGVDPSVAPAVGASAAS